MIRKSRPSVFRRRAKAKDAGDEKGTMYYDADFDIAHSNTACRRPVVAVSASTVVLVMLLTDAANIRDVIITSSRRCA